MSDILKKQHKGRIKGIRTKRKITHICNSINEGTYQLITKQCAVITEKQIDSCIRALKLKIKKNGLIINRLYPITGTRTQKASKTRMGKGKGTIEYTIRKVKGGTILFELKNIQPSLALDALNIVSKKLFFKTFIYHK